MLYSNICRRATQRTELSAIDSRASSACTSDSMADALTASAPTRAAADAPSEIGELAHQRKIAISTCLRYQD
eukprot:6191956-Pleurochrysis_carterae.AAC.1